MVKNSGYVYMDHLHALDSYRQGSDLNQLIISQEVYTPLSLEDWALELSDHPDREFVKFILDGIANGFRIGFNRSQPLQPAVANLQCTNPQVITEYLGRETALNRMWKCPRGYVPRGGHISPLGLIPKKNKPGKWRMIMDLSAPQGWSVNDGIDSELSSLSYSSIDQLAALVVSEGKGSWLVKADIKEAYRMVPVHPEDQHLLGVRWDQTVYIDRMLPFGLRSAPKLFSAVADAIQWIIHRKGITKGLHYLDDFILVAGNRHRAEHQKITLVATFDKLKVPIEQSKLEGPSTCLSFLGIEIDTELFQLRLPSSKLFNLKDTLAECIQLKSMTKRHLQKLTGLLQFATKVVRPGRPFLRRLYALQEVGNHPNHFVRLNQAARADLMWWYIFTERWNGISLLWDLGLTGAHLQTWSDASGSWGCGAFQGPLWLQLQWTPKLQHLSIAIKELIPVVLAAATFGHQWSGKVVEFIVDNEAVVEVINATYSKDLHLMHLIRLLVFLAARHNFWFMASHIPGKQNVVADSLSRNNMQLFRLQAPQAASQGSNLSSSLVDLLAQNITWTSTTWIKQFRDSFQQV